MPSKAKLYPLDQSCLYKLNSRKRLAKYLFLSISALEELAKTGDRYRSWDEKKKSGGTRRIEAPHDNLKAVQKRIATLLQSIDPPNYLMAPVGGRSYVDNAAIHVGAKAFRLLDIENFFPSCTDKRVFWFFNKFMKCSPDVSALITKLVTYNGHLPQGSPCSPILAYFSYADMWEEINSIVSNSMCTLSIYADDITISGDVVYEKDVWAVKSCLHRFGHKYHTEKERSLIGRAADITGVIVAYDELRLPNRQHKKINIAQKAYQNAASRPEKESLKRQLLGRYAQANQITKHIQ